MKQFTGEMQQIKKTGRKEENHVLQCLGFERKNEEKDIILAQLKNGLLTR